MANYYFDRADAWFASGGESGGGEFLNALFVAFSRADEINLARLALAFPDAVEGWKLRRDQSDGGA